MKRMLGNSGIEVSVMGLGCWAIGGPFWEGSDALGWGEIDTNEAIKAIEAGIDLGINFFDTADVYGAGQSERILANVLKGKRDKIIIATKFGITFNEDTKQVLGTDASPKYIIEACESSLKRLDTNYIDLYQFHLNDYDKEKAVIVRETLEELVEQGKIRTYGWSTDFTDRAAVFAQGEKCSSIQYQMSVIDENKDMIKFCESENLAGIIRGPLAMGLLSGKYNQQSSFANNDLRGANSPAWMQYFKNGIVNQDWLNKVEAVKEILTSEGRTLVQGSLAWIWAISKNTIPIPGFKNVKQVIENCKSLEFGPLSKVQVDEIDQLLGR